MTVVMSYVLTTRNKLDSLRLILPDLVANVRDDEELIVIDAGSTDGAVEYLREFQERGEIDVLVSEPDTGESHGFNKGILRARGDLIKLVTDDDAFHYPSIAECRRFMLEHDEVDILGGNIGRNWQIDTNFVHLSGDHKLFLRYQHRGLPFPFCGLSLMIRRTQLPLLGLCHPCCHLVDAEYTLRASTVANIAWAESFVAVRILNERSKLQNHAPSPELVDERKRLYAFYNFRTWGGEWPIPILTHPLREALSFCSWANVRAKCARARGISSSTAGRL